MRHFRCSLPVLLIIALALAGCSGEVPDQATAAAAKKPQAPPTMQFVEGYQQGAQISQQTGKPMLVFFTATWCTYCHQMAAEVFTQPTVAAMAERFVCVKVDADAEPAVCQHFRVQGFPTVQFLSPRGEPLNRVVGKQPTEQFLVQMQAALQSVARRESRGPTFAR